MHILKAGPLRVGFSFDVLELDRLFCERYRAFITSGPAAAAISVYTRPDLTPGFGGSIVRRETAGTIQLSSDAIRFIYDPAAGTGTLAIAADRDQAVDSLENALRAVIQALSVRSGALAVHAAAIARNGRCILCPGAHAAGKSTLADRCSAAGLEVLGDDLVLVTGGEGEAPLVHGLPFRGATLVREFIPGPCRLVRVLFIGKGRSIAFRPVQGAEAVARFMCNVPFMPADSAGPVAEVLSLAQRIIAAGTAEFTYDLDSGPEGMLQTMLGVPSNG